MRFLTQILITSCLLCGASVSSAEGDPARAVLKYHGDKRSVVFSAEETQALQALFNKLITPPKKVEPNDIIRSEPRGNLIMGGVYYGIIDGGFFLVHNTQQSVATPPDVGKKMQKIIRDPDLEPANRTEAFVQVLKEWVQAEAKK